MSANPPGAIAASKSANTAAQLSPQAQSGSSSAGDSYSQRRAGGSGSFGAGAASRAYPSPRHNQASKRKHKPAKRPGLANEDAIAEAVAMRSTGSRKGQTSITHLMNFSLPPRPQNHGHGYGRSYRRNPAWGPGSGYHAVDKARYVHANYRFIVDPRGDYQKQAIDADVHLDWNNVLQVLASAQSQSASCPICLETPVAPRMAKCGHIFCLPCLIRFMHAEVETKLPEKKAKSKKCPICEDNIYLSDTRPTRFYIGQEGEPPREGADVVLRLVMRSSGSMLALPRDGADALPKGEEVPWYIAAEVMDFARIMKGSEDYMAEQLERDIREIDRQAREDEVMFGEDNMEWTKKAIRMIKESKEKVKGIGNPPTSATKPPENKAKKSGVLAEESDINTSHTAPAVSNLEQTPSNEEELVPTNTVVQPESAGSEQISLDSSGEQQSTSTSNLSKSLAEFRNRQPDGQTPSEYYFYQALLHYYLSPLDIRILKAAFGNFASFPSTILPRVERVSTGHVVDDDLRKRTKYLGHLPYGCEVGFLECDWTDTVAPEILEKFKSEIERRRKRNHDKEMKEEKARVRAEREEDQKAYAQARRKRNSISNTGFTADDFQPLGSAEVSGSVEADGASSSPPYAQRQGSAFASLASPSTSPSAPRTVWGTTAIPGSSPVLQASVHEHDADDGWLQGWEKELLGEDAMIAQAQAMSLGNGESSSAGAGGNGGGGGGGGKKKKKKITLMSTNVRRGA
ncbi:putative RING finger protein [Diplodia seriata]|uniref:Putative RING finger protein n=1 Tax=Diplodia seriata TaxID=420778 RepID=A0A1S8BME7_9PEZI|nr:putative RING finger protein [Diplodia seriata]